METVIAMKSREPPCPTSFEVNPYDHNGAKASTGSCNNCIYNGVNTDFCISPQNNTVVRWDGRMVGVWDLDCPAAAGFTCKQRVILMGSDGDLG